MIHVLNSYIIIFTLSSKILMEMITKHYFISFKYNNKIV